VSTDWWDAPYAPKAPSERRTVAAGTAVRGGGRLPAPGQVVDLGAEMQPKPADAPEPDTGDEVPQAPDAPEPDPTPEPAVSLAKDSAPDAPEQRASPQAHPVADALDRLADRLTASGEQAGQDAVRGLTPRQMWPLYNGAAAAAGYAPALITRQAGDGLPSLMRDVVARAGAAPYHWSTGIAVGMVVIGASWWLVDRRRRAISGTSPGAQAVRWVLRIPLASAVLGLLLWAPAWDAFNL
jgi:hypothetical protein